MTTANDKLERPSREELVALFKSLPPDRQDKLYRLVKALKAGGQSPTDNASDS